MSRGFPFLPRADYSSVPLLLHAEPSAAPHGDGFFCKQMNARLCRRPSHGQSFQNPFPEPRLYQAEPPSASNLVRRTFDLEHEIEMSKVVMVEQVVPVAAPEHAVNKAVCA